MHRLLFTALFQTLMFSTVSSYPSRKHDLSQRIQLDATFNGTLGKKTQLKLFEV